MTALAWFLAVYLTGIATLLVLDYADRIHLEPMARAVWLVVARRYRYAGRHRAGERWSTSQTNVALAEAREQSVCAEREARQTWNAPTQSLFLPVFVDEAPLCPPMYPAITHYDQSAGKANYLRLRPALLDAAAEKAQARLAAPVVDLRALRVRGAAPTVGEVDDEWWAAVVAS